MPEVHFIGEIAFVSLLCEAVSITWAIVPGNSAWYLKRGIAAGETHTGIICAESGKGLLSHPIDCQYEASSSEGWPLFVCEVWDRSCDGIRNYCGSGSVWLPSNPGKHDLDMHLWKPCSSGLQNISGMLLPSIPDLKALRELTMSPYLRSQIKSEHTGNIQLSVSVIVSGFDAFGVKLAP